MMGVGSIPPDLCSCAKAGIAKGVMFITIEDETGPANLVVWPTLFEKRRRIVLGSSMMAINGRIQREGEVVHLVAQQLFDWSQAIWPLWLIVTNSSSERRRGQRVRALQGPGVNF